MADVGIHVIPGKTLDAVMSDIENVIEYGEHVPTPIPPSAPAAINNEWSCDSYTLDGYEACHIEGFYWDGTSVSVYYVYIVSQIDDQIYKIKYSSTGLGDDGYTFKPMINSFKHIA